MDTKERAAATYITKWKMLRSNATNSQERTGADRDTLFSVVIDGDDGGVALSSCYAKLVKAFALRKKYRTFARTGDVTLCPASQVSMVRGVISFAGRPVCPQVSFEDYIRDVELLKSIARDATCLNAASHRLSILQERSRMFCVLNAHIEELPKVHKGAIRLVDNSVQLSYAAHGQLLLTHVLSIERLKLTSLLENRYRNTQKMPQSLANRLVHSPFEGEMTTRSLTETPVMKVDLSLLTLRGLRWHHRYTEDDAEQTRMGLGDKIRDTFMSCGSAPSVSMLTKYFTSTLFSHHAVEHRIPIYGTHPDELFEIAEFIVNNNLCHDRNRWFLEIRFSDLPASYDKTPVSCTLEEQLACVFKPMILAHMERRSERFKTLSKFLLHVGGIHIEAQTSAEFLGSRCCTPDGVPFAQRGDGNVLYTMYYCHTNLAAVNKLRAAMHQPQFQLRVQGWRFDAIVAGYLFADVITDFATNEHRKVLEYLLGMHRVGLTVAPSYNAAHGIAEQGKHPLPMLLHRCLNVSISTEQPLVCHHTANALREEYTLAQRLYRLSRDDMDEFAFNSVVMSSFPTKLEKTARMAFRDEMWKNENEILTNLQDNSQQSLRIETTGGSRWHRLSTVKDVEYFLVRDNRIRFPRTVICGPHQIEIAQHALSRIVHALKLRNEYMWKKPNPWEVVHRRSEVDDFAKEADNDVEYASIESVLFHYRRGTEPTWPSSIKKRDEFRLDLQELKATCSSVDVRDFASRRLQLLDHKFALHLALNLANEAGMTHSQASTNRDIYQAVKVDTHIHMAAGMAPRQMLAFMMRKIQGSKDDIIGLDSKKKIITFGKLMEDHQITTNLTVDQLNVQADYSLFQRFDNFNNKYNPMEKTELRTLLLKTDNFMNGRYFAELIRDVFDAYAKDRYTYAENRLSIYGTSITEWDTLANWFNTHGMASKHNKWIIQVPRVYKVFKKLNKLQSFGHYIRNIFSPLWEASLRPAEHPILHNFLNHVSGFDSVDNEAIIDLPFQDISAEMWTVEENPPYNYYLYYLYANIRTLNEYRASRGFSVFDLRPHCGESGSDEHLYGAFLCAQAVAHGINLKNDPALQYLYYLAQIGLHVSPLSNNALFLHFLENPFPTFFKRGLNVSLSTDDPMMFHQTQEPLIEEYSIAARVWGLSPNDLCEIARNSVLQCGFDDAFKREAIGDRYYMSSSLGNDPNRTHLSDIRVAFRFETYHTELQFLQYNVLERVPRAMKTSTEEAEIADDANTVKEENVVYCVSRDREHKLKALGQELTAAKERFEELRRQQNALVEKLQSLRQQLSGQEGQCWNQLQAFLSSTGTAEASATRRLLNPRPPPQRLPKLARVVAASTSRPLPKPPMGRNL